MIGEWVVVTMWVKVSPVRFRKWNNAVEFSLPFFWFICTLCRFVWTIQNTSYSVLKRGIPQSIELKENAAYSSVNTQLANSWPIARNSNVAYRIASVNTKPIYDELLWVQVCLLHYKSLCIFIYFLQGAVFAYRFKHKSFHFWIINVFHAYNVMYIMWKLSLVINV